MNRIDKKALSETDICDLFITPAIKNAGWDTLNNIRHEVTLSPGTIIVRGNMSSRSKKNSLTMFTIRNWVYLLPLLKQKTIKETVSDPHS
jgi:type I restriction enzyme R subunit